MFSFYRIFFANIDICKCVPLLFWYGVCCVLSVFFTLPINLLVTPPLYWVGPLLTFYLNSSICLWHGSNMVLDFFLPLLIWHNPTGGVQQTQLKQNRIWGKGGRGNKFFPCTVNVNREWAIRINVYGDSALFDRGFHLVTTAWHVSTQMNNFFIVLLIPA